ncbi:AMP-binding protein [Dasania sp. GY-19]|uniref:AMP-binding protein n=1 Tax=Dasania phycosphaerae TaxID=2950436 RepID=A0A9J6RRQ7_9GAMM|nr:AMP-binding protein [Dasania phycosphaerae]MCZ0867140.1 AMP-binding protein [Dasania phycosphaerae]
MDYVHNRNRIAFLQYTSGSTGSPKGVCVTHGNLLANEGMLTRMWNLSRDTVYVTWLPLFHDMGLIGVLLQVLYIGGHCVMMPSAAFAMQPVRWLKAIEKYRANISGGPNFAFKWLCSDRVFNSIKKLDLSSLITIYCGSEPISMQTAESFRAAYRQYGLSSSAFFPCYGMAEATLCVSGGPISREPVYRQMDIFSEKCLTSDAEVVEKDRPIRTVVGCGAPVEQDVRIVNPVTFKEVTEGETGEIWVNGPNIAPGYWGREDINKEVFGAQIVGSPGKKYLRTGDLAFVKSGEIFVNGRIKELIICNGQNYYPQDIEQSASNSHEATEGMPAAAFLENDMDTDTLVIVQEIDRKYNHSISEQFVEEVKRKMVTSVYRDYALPIKGVFLVRKNTIPRTTSGKICRLSCRIMLANEEFRVEGCTMINTKKSIQALEGEKRYDNESC